LGFVWELVLLFFFPKKIIVGSAAAMAVVVSSIAVAAAAAGAVQAASSSGRVGGQVSSLLFVGKRVTSVASTRTVQRAARLAIQARLGSVTLAELEGALEGAMASVVDLAVKNVAFKNATFVAMNALMVLPALAEEEKGKIFDFNLTLPIIAVQFLLLMVALDNIWFKPVAKVMDTRDETIRSKLLGVRDNSGEIKKLQEEAEAIIKAARIETTMALNQTKRETAAALDEKLQESRARIEKELAQSLKNLEEQKEDTLKSLDKQVQALSEEILRKVIPFKV
jgi:F-type H+-transporting ATPase subunit b